MLMFKEKAFEKIICKHCALAGEVGCLLKDEGFVCSTLKRIEEEAIMFSDDDISLLLAGGRTDELMEKLKLCSQNQAQSGGQND